MPIHNNLSHRTHSALSRIVPLSCSHPHIPTHKHSSLIAISYDAVSSFVAETRSYVRV